MATNSHKFAPGHDNTANLKALWELDPPKFDRYKIDHKTVWHGEVERVRNGALEFVRLGLPSIEVLLEVISTDELALLRTTFFSSGDLSVPVTVRTLNMYTETFTNYNGTMHWPENLQRDRSYYPDVVLVIDELEAI